MTRLFNAAAAGLTSIFLTMPAFAQEPEAKPPVNDNKTPPVVSVVNVHAAAVQKSSTFFVNVLKFVDDNHFSGDIKVNHEDIAKGAAQAMFRSVYIEEELSENAVEFKDANKEEIKSISFGGKKITLEDPVLPLNSYEDVARYLQASAESLSDASDISIMRLYEFALNGALHESRDPHTSYMWKERSEKFNQSIRGEFVGIGVALRMQDGLIEVIEPMEDSPAEKAGLKAGDLITAVDGVAVKGKSLEEATDLIGGKAGTDVKLTIKRGDEDPFDVTVTRAKITVKAVKGELIGENDETAYFKITSFSRTTTNDLIEALHKMLAESKKSGNPIRSIVLDVRNNPGGLLSQAKIISDLFLQEDGGDPDPIVAVGKTPKDGQTFVDTVVNMEIGGAPVIVLQNEYSASASEIVAGALKDGGKRVVGQTSYGKGSVQNLIGLNEKGEPVHPSSPDAVGMVKLTTAAFFPGKTGLSNQGSGIIPNVKVVYGDFRDELVANAQREEDNEHALLSAEATRAGRTPEYICTVKKEFAGVLSAETIKMLPPELVKDMRIKDPDTGKFKDVKVFDADLDAALNVLNGGSPYSIITEFKKAAEDPANDNEKDGPQLEAPENEQRPPVPAPRPGM